MARIFISYSRKNADFARQLATSLSDLGADVWIDIEDIPAGMKWSSAIQQGLDLSEVMLVVLSPDSMASHNVEDEWQYYLDQKKPIIPVLVEPAKVHFQLSRVQYIDFHGQPYEAALRQLHAELRRKGIELNPLPSSSAATPTPPPQQPLPVITPTASAAVSNRFPVSPRTGLAVISAAVLVIVAVVALIVSQGNLTDSPSATLTSIAVLSTTIFTDTPPPPSETPELTPTAESTDVTLVPTSAGNDAPIGGGSGQIAYASNMTGDFDIYVMDIATGATSRLTDDPRTDRGPSWSPDGKRIAFWSTRDGNSEIYVMDADGSNLTRLTNNGDLDRSPVWSPDGKYIAFWTDRDNNYEIYYVADTFVGEKRITNTGGSDVFPAWGIDSSTLIAAFTQDSRSGTGQIGVINPGKTQPQPLFESTVNNTFPTWSPDGNKIAFVAASGSTNHHTEITVMNSDGSNSRTLTQDDGNHLYPAWSPDSNKIVFARDTVGDSNLYMVDADGTSLHTITGVNAVFVDPAWRPSVASSDYNLPSIEFTTTRTPPLTLEANQLPAIVSASNRVILRKTPNGTILANLPPGERLVVKAKDAETPSWLKVIRDNGDIGWIFASSLSVGGDLAVLPVESS